jgi:hypothetical protein
MEYTEVSADDLMKLREGLGVLERLSRDLVSGMDIYVYGITSSPAILDAAREAIAADSGDELSEEDIQLSEIACAIVASPDTLHYLTGSGVKLGRGDEFSYQGEAGEGIRTVDFAFSRVQALATVSDFQHLALAESNGWIDKYMTQHGSKVPVKVEVKRNAPATGIAPPPAPAPAAPGVPKQTSVYGAKQLRDLMENFLGGN